MNATSIRTELAQIVFKAMNSRDLSIAEPLLHENVVFDFPGNGIMEGPKRVSLFIRVLLRKYPELTFTIQNVILDGDQACTVWTNKGKNLDGSLYENSGITHFHFSEGKITFMSDYFKNTSFVNQS